MALAPQDIGPRNALGLVQARLERYADALATFDAVVALQPDFAGTQTNVELPELSSLPTQWANYVDGQDLVGFDRDRIRHKGDEYLARAVEEAID